MIVRLYSGPGATSCLSISITLDQQTTWPIRRRHESPLFNNESLGFSWGRGLRSCKPAAVFDEATARPRAVWSTGGRSRATPHVKSGRSLIGLSGSLCTICRPFESTTNPCGSSKSCQRSRSVLPCGSSERTTAAPECFRYEAVGSRAYAPARLNCSSKSTRLGE